MPKQCRRLHGAQELGMILMQIFFAVIGTGAHIATVLKVGPILFVFAAIILMTHFAAVILGGKLCRLDLREALVASNAATGGPTTAVAMAASQRWQGLVTPAILVGTLGYGVATFIGVAVGKILH